MVLPTREDIWGLVVNEAMAAGTPVITTNKCIAGVELIEDGKTGYIVLVEDEVALAYRIKEILENTDQTLMMRNNCLKKIRKYTFESMVQRHIDVLKD